MAWFSVRAPKKKTTGDMSLSVHIKTIDQATIVVPMETALAFQTIAAALEHSHGQ